MNDKKKAKPELRFKGFTEDWEEKKLGEVAEFRRGLTYSPKDICDDNKGIRVLRSSNISDNTFILSEDDVFVHSSAINIPYIGNNDILITAANGSIRLVGKHCLVKGIQSNSCVPGGFMLSASTDIPDFLQASMGTMWYQTFITTYTSGGTGSISNLNKSSLEEQNVLFPTSLAEQEKIGTFFKELDDLIGAKEQELEKLRQLKAALLEAMFPSEDTSDHNRGGADYQ